MVTENELTPREVEAFGNLPKENIPPKILEDNTIKALKNKKLIMETSLFKKHWRPVASAILFFVIGHLSATWFVDLNQVQTTQSSRFILMLHEDDNFRGNNELSEEYFQWLLGIRDQQRFITGEQLADGVNWLESNKEVYGADRVTGYFILEAENMEEAVLLSKTAPHLKYGGRIEVREIVNH